MKWEEQKCSSTELKSDRNFSLGNIKVEFVFIKAGETDRGLPSVELKWGSMESGEELLACGREAL